MSLVAVVCLGAAVIIGTHLAYTRLVATPHCVSLCRASGSELQEVFVSGRKGRADACVCRDRRIESLVPGLGYGLGVLVLLGTLTGLARLSEPRSWSRGR